MKKNIVVLVLLTVIVVSVFSYYNIKVERKDASASMEDVLMNLPANPFTPDDVRERAIAQYRQEKAGVQTQGQVVAPEQLAYPPDEMKDFEEKWFTEDYAYACIRKSLETRTAEVATAYATRSMAITNYLIYQKLAAIESD